MKVAQLPILLTITVLGGCATALPQQAQIQPQEEPCSQAVRWLWSNVILTGAAANDCLRGNSAGCGAVLVLVEDYKNNSARSTWCLKTHNTGDMQKYELAGLMNQLDETARLLTALNNRGQL